MADVILTNGMKGNFEDLKKDAVDPSDTIDDPKDPRFGQKRFLAWTLIRNSDGLAYWQAVGKDGKIYRIDEDVVVTPEPKKGVLTIT